MTHFDLIWMICKNIYRRLLDTLDITKGCPPHGFLDKFNLFSNVSEKIMKNLYLLSSEVPLTVGGCSSLPGSPPVLVPALGSNFGDFRGMPRNSSNSSSSLATSKSS